MTHLQNTLYPAHPDVVGSYKVGENSAFFAVTRAELDRASVCMANIIRTFGIAPGRFILSIALTPEIVQFAPFEFAMQTLGLFGTNADLSPYDSNRVESLSRQFDLAAICGVGQSTLDGLRLFGHDPAKVFKGHIIWARPDCYAEIAQMPGVNARRVLLIGPAMALESAHGDLIIDGREWAVSAKNGTLRLSSRMQRIDPVVDLDTGIAGHVLDTPAACGMPDPVISLD